MEVLTKLEEWNKAKDKEYQNQLYTQVQQRKAQEKDHSKGEVVWFSRRIKDGHLHHWALIVYGKKYELRLPTRQKYNNLLPTPTGKLVASIVPTWNFETNITPWSVYQEMMQIREENIATRGKPHAKNYYICQIGWTSLTEAEVDVACFATQASFGVYMLGWNDCQTFLRNFAAQIIRPELNQCALDFDWFNENVVTEYHKLQALEPNENIKAFQRSMEAALLGGSVAAGEQVVDSLRDHSLQDTARTTGGGSSTNPPQVEKADAAEFPTSKIVDTQPTAGGSMYATPPKSKDVTIPPDTDDKSGCWDCSCGG